MGSLRLLLIATAALIVAGCATPQVKSLDPEARVSPGGRTILVAIPQEEIKTNIEAAGVAAAAGGGLVMALIDAGIESSRAKRAEEAVTPLRDILMDFDFDAQAVAALDELVASHAYLGKRETSIARESTPAQRSAALDAATAPQVTFVDYEYSLDADFAGITTRLDVAIASQAIPEGRRPTDRLSRSNLVYGNTFYSHVRLPEELVSKTIDDNIAQFAANDGARARSALTQSITRLHWMLDKALSLTPEQAQAITDGPTVGWTIMRVVEETPEGTLHDVQTYWMFREDVQL